MREAALFSNHVVEEERQMQMLKKRVDAVKEGKKKIEERAALSSTTLLINDHAHSNLESSTSSEILSMALKKQVEALHLENEELRRKLRMRDDTEERFFHHAADEDEGGQEQEQKQHTSSFANGNILNANGNMDANTSAELTAAFSAWMAVVESQRQSLINDYEGRLDRMEALYEKQKHHFSDNVAKILLEHDDKYLRLIDAYGITTKEEKKRQINNNVGLKESRADAHDDVEILLTKQTERFQRILEANFAASALANHAGNASSSANVHGAAHSNPISLISSASSSPARTRQSLQFNSPARRQQQQQVRGGIRNVNNNNNSALSQSSYSPMLSIEHLFQKQSDHFQDIVGKLGESIASALAVSTAGTEGAIYHHSSTTSNPTTPISPLREMPSPNLLPKSTTQSTPEPDEEREMELPSSSRLTRTTIRSPVFSDDGNTIPLGEPVTARQSTMPRSDAIIDGYNYEEDDLAESSTGTGGPELIPPNIHFIIRPNLGE